MRWPWLRAAGARPPHPPGGPAAMREPVAPAWPALPPTRLTVAADAPLTRESEQERMVAAVARRIRPPGGTDQLGRPLLHRAAPRPEGTVRGILHAVSDRELPDHGAAPPPVPSSPELRSRRGSAEEAGEVPFGGAGMLPGPVPPRSLPARETGATHPTSPLLHLDAGDLARIHAAARAGSAAAPPATTDARSQGRESAPPRPAPEPVPGRTVVRLRDLAGRRPTQEEPPGSTSPDDRAQPPEGRAEPEVPAQVEIPDGRTDGAPRRGLNHPGSPPGHSLTHPRDHQAPGHREAAPESPAPGRGPASVEPARRSQPVGSVARAAAAAAKPLVPASLADELRRLRGIEVGDAQVRRGPAAELEVRALGARAVTRAGEVLIPDHAGPLDRGRGRALLAHELIHVDQQRRLGSALPAEASPEGRALEREAAAVEASLAHGSGGGAEATGSASADPSWAEFQLEMLESGFARRDPSGALVFATAAVAGDAVPSASGWRGMGAASLAGVQRAAEDATAEDSATEAPSGWRAAAPANATPAEGDGRAEPALAPGVPGPARLQDIEDGDLDILAERIYQRVRLDLQSELSLDRERSGLVADL